MKTHPFFYRYIFDSKSSQHILVPLFTLQSHLAIQTILCVFKRSRIPLFYLECTWVILAIRWFELMTPEQPELLILLRYINYLISLTFHFAVFQQELQWGYDLQVTRPQITLDIGGTPCHFLTETRNESMFRKLEKSPSLQPFVHVQFQKLWT